MLRKCHHLIVLGTYLVFTCSFSACKKKDSSTAPQSLTPQQALYQKATPEPGVGLLNLKIGQTAHPLLENELGTGTPTRDPPFVLYAYPNGLTVEVDEHATQKPITRIRLEKPYSGMTAEGVSLGEHRARLSEGFRANIKPVRDNSMEVGYLPGIIYKIDNEQKIKAIEIVAGSDLQTSYGTPAARAETTTPSTNHGFHVTDPKVFYESEMNSCKKLGKNNPRLGVLGIDPNQLKRLERLNVNGYCECFNAGLRDMVGGLEGFGKIFMNSLNDGDYHDVPAYGAMKEMALIKECAEKNL